MCELAVEIDPRHYHSIKDKELQYEIYKRLQTQGKVE